MYNKDNADKMLNELVFEKGVLTPLYDNQAISHVSMIIRQGKCYGTEHTRRNNPPVYVLEDYGEIKFYYPPDDFRPVLNAIRMVLNSLVCNGNCHSYDLERLPAGEIVVRINPACHRRSDRQLVIDEVAETLCGAWIYH